MNIPTLTNFKTSDGVGIIRADLDTITDGKITSDRRLEVLLPTLKLLLEKGAKKLLVIGHNGRPEKYDEKYTTKPISKWLSTKLDIPVGFARHYPMNDFYVVYEEVFTAKEKVIVLDNLRFWGGEIENEELFVEELGNIGSFYVNESFGNSHRNHASIVGLPKYFKDKGNDIYAGLNFENEIKNLNKIFENSQKPIVSIISGIKDDKKDYVEAFKKFSDLVLVAGRLPDYFPEDINDPKLIIARLNPDKEDITLRSIEKFEAEIAKAGTIILAGPIGKYEEPGHLLGTQRVFQAVADSKATFKLAGGGDTTQAIKLLQLDQAFDWISTGGGAMLEYLAKRTLPGIEVLQNIE